MQGTTSNNLHMKSQVTYFFKNCIETWVFYASTLFLLGYFIFPTTKLHNLFLHLGVCIPLVFLVPFFYKKLRLSNWIIVSTISFSAYLFLSSIWSIDYTFQQTSKYLQYLLTLYCVIGAVFFVQYKRPDYSEYLFKGFILIGSLHYTYGIWEHFHVYPNPLHVRYSKIQPIDEAMLAGMLILACFWLITEQKKLSHKAVIFGLSIPFVVVVLLAKSRGPQLALVVSFALAGYFKGMRLKDFVALTLIVSCLLLSALFLTDTGKQIFSRGLEFPYRMQIWSISLHQGLENFWFGQGATRNAPIFVDGVKFNHSHNILLSVFRLGGIVGVMLFLVNLLLCLAVGFKQQNSITKLWVVWLFFGVLCLMTNGRFPLARPTSLWFAYWIPIAFISATASVFKIEYSKNGPCDDL